MNPLYEAHLQHASGLKLRAVSARAQGDDGATLAALLLHEPSDPNGGRSMRSGRPTA